MARDKEQLKALGITSILSMAADCGPQFPGDFRYHSKALIEHSCSIADIISAIPRSVSFILEEFESAQNNRVLIHCVQGKTRSASIATYTIACKNGTYEKILQKIRLSRDKTIPEE